MKPRGAIWRTWRVAERRLGPRRYEGHEGTCYIIRLYPCQHRRVVKGSKLPKSRRRAVCWECTARQLLERVKAPAAPPARPGGKPPVKVVSIASSSPRTARRRRLAGDDRR